ncbi:MAG: M20 family metallo-hydrolase [Alphaproteobacteria bacterium]|nr:M20 family metallo-hydrolase [Alphaproteobacteria bacterium]
MDMRAAAAVSQDRLWGRLAEMARLGATPKGGVNRQALTEMDGLARRTLADWALGRGFSIFQDEMANLFVRREGQDESLPPVTTGSHLDTQPTGGRFDGAYGVMAGFEALEALEDAGVETLHPVEVVAWTNEEGSWFPNNAMGSAIYAGKRPLETALATQNPDGERFADAVRPILALTDDAAPRALGAPMAAYVEAHIEQGPVLEAQEETIGVVTSIQAQHRYTVDILGREAHAGTTPRANRADAVMTAVEIIAALEREARDPDDLLRFTVGRLQAYPGSPNTVPGKVHFTIDLRHPDDSTIEAMAEKITTIPGRIAAQNDCEATVSPVSGDGATPFDAGVIDLVDSVRDALDLPGRRMASGAGHDAMYMAARCPTGMIFVPCVGGISHNEAEDAKPEDLAAGARVLAGCLERLACPA